ncbi:MAG: sigma-70 family RNA polymerase sigma factor [Candidatus Omnitrophica bacterium]|nr:sigma-70 family RNA polymerase sigma factor [Candidatus Omnitrophota bacterium]MDD5546590.1 sigma-70 family RNA polymerase sigma factor [Candidatus Omnitrophota bacterium]
MGSSDLASPSPEQLIEGCIKKDKRSWDMFVERYSKVVYWAIRDRLKRLGYNFEDEDINDIHQDVFIALWAGDKLAQLKEKDKVAGWLAMVAGNAAVDHFRRMKRQSPPNSISIYEEIYKNGDGGTRTLEEVLPSKAPGPDREAQLSEAREALESVIEALKPKEKIAVKLDILHGMKHSEIADALNIPVNTVSTTIARAKKYLKEKLEKERLL